MTILKGRLLRLAGIYSRFARLVLLALCFSGLVNSGSARVLNVADYGAYPNDGLDDTQAINNTIAAAGAGDTVLFAAGTYDLIAPHDSTQFIAVNGKAGITLQGATTAGGAPNTTLLRHVSLPISSIPHTIYCVNNANLMIANFTIDNSPRLCSAGKVTSISSTTLQIQIPVGMPMDASVPCYSANVWDASGSFLKAVPDLAADVSPANWTIYDPGTRTMQLTASGGLKDVAHNYFSSSVAVNDWVSWHYGTDGSAQVEMETTTGLVLTNLVVPNTINMAFLFGACGAPGAGNGISLSNITLVPSGGQLSVGPRDGIHLSRCGGTLTCYGLNITGVHEDGFVVRSPYTTVATTIPGGGKTFDLQSELATFQQPISSGSTLNFIDPTGVITNYIVDTAIPDGNAGLYHVTTTTPFPAAIPIGTAVKVQALMPSSTSLTASSFSNIAGSALILFVDNVTVNDLDFSYIMYPTVVMGSNPTSGVCGNNLSISGCVFDQCSWLAKPGTNASGMIALKNGHNPFQSTGAHPALLSKPLVQNVTINGSNSFSWQLNDSSIPSIGVYDTSTITISNNIFYNVWDGLMMDAGSGGSVSGYSVLSNTVIVDNDSNSATYSESPSADFHDSSLKGYNLTKTRYSANSGTKATWIFVAPKSSSYYVSVYKVVDTASDSSAQLSLLDGSVSLGTAIMDGTTGTSGWYPITGSAFPLVGGHTYTVTNARSNGNLRADAVRFVQTP